MSDYDDDPLLPDPKNGFPWPGIVLLAMVIICVMGIVYLATGGMHG